MWTEMHGCFFQHLSNVCGKFQAVFVLTQENTFSERFHFNTNRKSVDSSRYHITFSNEISLKILGRDILILFQLAYI